MLLLYYFLILTILNPILAIFYPTNETDLSRCKVHYSKPGTTYKDFYEIPKKKENSSLLDIHFTVLAPSDAHILLASSYNVQKTDPAYEIVIGAGGNSFCDIRKMQKSDVKESVRIKGLLSAVDYRSFWIHMSYDGLLEVGREGENKSFIKWKDSNPLPVKVISFSTWPGIEAKWLFACITDERKIKRTLSNTEKLRQDLLTNYDPYVRPVKNYSDITTVSLQLVTRSFVLDEYSSEFELKGVAKLSWQDEKLVWNETEYGNIKNLHIFRREIWQPNIMLYNAIDTDKDILDDSMMIVQSSGIVQWDAAFYVKIWCPPNNLKSWPHDTRKCNFLFTFWNDYSNIQLEFTGNNTKIVQPYSSPWKIYEVEILLNSGWQNVTAIDDNEVNVDPPTLNISFLIKRSTHIYEVIFVSPLVVTATLILCSFFVSPFLKTKILMGCLSLLISSISLIGLDLYIPKQTKSVPYLVLLYCFSLVLGVTSIIISVITIKMAFKETKIPKVLKYLLSSNALKFLCCLPKKKLCDSNDKCGRFSQMSFSLKAEKKENQQIYWIMLGKVIDRVCFVFVLFIMIYLFWIA